MSKGQLKTGIGWALCALALFAAPGCAVDSGDPDPDDIEQEDPTVVTDSPLDPDSMGGPANEVQGSQDGPSGKNDADDSSSGISTDEEEEPDPDPWQIPSLPGGGDDDGSGDMDDP